jgi:hypothetical protein
MNGNDGLVSRWLSLKVSSLLSLGSTQEKQMSTDRKKLLTWKAIAIFVGLASWYATTANAVVLYTNTIYSDNFDSDTLGQLPSGWSGSRSGLPTVNNNAFVTNNISKSAPNSFKNTYTNAFSYDVTTSFPGVNLVQFDQGLSYSLDLNVESIANNNSEGFRIGVDNNVHRLDAGSPRILREGTVWSFFNQFNGQNFLSSGFNFNQWYNFRVDFSPISPTTGTAFWYMDGTLINTEPYTKPDNTYTPNVHIFEILDIPGNSATMYVDNVLIQAIIPEPSTVALLAVGGFVFFSRRRLRV